MKEKSIKKAIEIHVQRQLERQRIVDARVAQYTEEHYRPTRMKQDQEYKLGGEKK